MAVQMQEIHSHTPTLTVLDPRGLTVRSVAYCRSVEAMQPEERITRSACDALGRVVEQWDPRLWALRAEDTATPANLNSRYSLSGKVLASISVDAGERISLFGGGDQMLQSWDSRGTERRIEYDDLLRPLAIIEQGEGATLRCSERYEYADSSAGFAAHNQCGQLIRHDDPAGTQTLDEYALTGGVLEQTQRFLLSLDLPDWPSALPERDVLLEPVAQAASSSARFNPLGDVLEQTDAKGNRQSFDYTVDGVLVASHLQLSAQANPQTLVSEIVYSAYGQVERETAGNGVVSMLTYRPEDGRLTRLQARYGSEVLQDLRYDYDPVGNVLSIEEAALPIRFFANQRVEPIKRYRYDTLYQLIEATGWEAGAVNQGPGCNRFDDPGAVANYRQTYHYDAGGNLLELIHVGPQNHSRRLTAARYSNRCLPEQNERPPTEEEIAAAFDGNGNLLELQPGQVMGWDLRNQLREVRPVEREDSEDDRELYRYGGDGMRRRKLRMSQTNARSLISEVRYLPGLELRTHEGTGEVLQVISVQAGRSVMRVLHWETTPPSGIANDQYRYNLTDHLGSSSLELDEEAQVISQEVYHPYGSTAWFAGRTEVEAGYKTVRYSGKERDATGLYYYGFRYYAPWLQRWINPDPVGNIEGLNFYAFLKGGPINRTDENGLWGDEDQKLKYFRLNPPRAIHEGRNVDVLAADGFQKVMARGLDDFAPDERAAIADSLFVAPIVLQEAQWMQRYQPGISEPVLKNIFGPEHTQEHSTILSSWNSTENLLRFYHNSEFGRGKFVRSGGDDRYLAFIDRTDFQGHIFIGDGFMQLTPKAQVDALIHETSHLSSVTRFTTGGGAMSQDFYYFPDYAELGRQYAAGIAEHGGMQLDDIKATSGFFRSGVKEWGEKNIAGAGNIKWSEEASVFYHNVNPKLRAYIAARNADSLALAAQLLSDMYVSRQYHP